MDVFESVKTVLAVREYQSTPVPPEIVARIVEAGRLSASSMNGQPWHFVVVDDNETLKKIGALARTGPYIAKAPLAIVVLTEDSPYAVSDTSRAVQSMVLTAWAEGVGSNWVGFMGPNEVKPLLGIPDAMQVLAILPFGYPVKTLGQGKKKRKALAEVASHGRYGQPFTAAQS